MVSINDTSALLLYRVGPVLCCAPSQPVSAIIVPSALTHPPGSNPGHPGIFRHAGNIVRELDLRVQFGVDESAWVSPGRSIIAGLEQGHIGFHVDTILDVIALPASGWGNLPALLPRGVFSRTLLHKDRIYLYAELSQLQHIPHSGYLRQYIAQLLAPAPTASDTATVTTVPEPTTPATTASVRTPSASVDPGRPQVRYTARHATPAHTPMPASAHKHRNPVSATTQSSSASSAASATPFTHRSSIPAAATKQITSTEKPAPPDTNTITNRHAAAKTETDFTGSPTPVKPATHRAAHVAMDENRHGFSTALFLFALLGLFGAGLWYSFGDAGFMPASPQQAATTATPASAQSDDVGPDKAGATPAPSVASARASQSASSATVPVSPVSQPPATHDASHAASEPVQITAVASKAQAATLSKRYHASIENDVHGITITVDEPADNDVTNSSFNTIGESQPTPGTATTSTARKSSSEQATAHTTTPSNAAAVSHTRVIIHIVVKGDTLWAIAKKYVKDPFRYPELARLSKIRNPDLIYPGERIRIVKRIHQTH